MRVQCKEQPKLFVYIREGPFLRVYGWIDCKDLMKHASTQRQQSMDKIEAMLCRFSRRQVCLVLHATFSGVILQRQIDSDRRGRATLCKITAISPMSEESESYAKVTALMLYWERDASEDGEMKGEVGVPGRKKD